MIEDKEAERRVWYVALTRAKETVIILENIQGITYNLKIDWLGEKTGLLPVVRKQK